MVANFVDMICCVSVVLSTSIHRSPLAVPYAEISLVHPLALLFIAPSQAPLLDFCARVLFICSREAKEGIIMDRVGRVLPSFMRITELGKIGRKGISVKENGMVGVDSANDVVNLVVKFDEPTVLGIGRLVKWVVASNPFVAFVVLGELRPEPEDAILEVFMVPDYRELSSA